MAVMNSHGHDVERAERAYVQSMLDLADDRLNEASEAMEARLAALRDDSALRWADELRAHRERADQFEEDQRAWLARFIGDDADEGAHTDVAQGQGGASPAGPPASPAGPDPGQPNHAAELAEAERIKDMPMATYAQERQRLIRANTGLFG
jgi:hypothetical protein